MVVLFIYTIALHLVALFLYFRYKKTYTDLTTTISQKKSSEVRLGQIVEAMAPFLNKFPYDPKKAHFMGMPIDYIVFDDNAVIFLEVKSGNAQLSQTQRKIKKLIEDKQVEWKELRIN